MDSSVTTYTFLTDQDKQRQRRTKVDKDGQRRTIEFWNIVYLQDITCHSLHQEIISQKVKPPQQIKEL